MPIINRPSWAPTRRDEGACAPPARSGRSAAYVVIGVIAAVAAAFVIPGDRTSLPARSAALDDVVIVRGAAPRGPAPSGRASATAASVAGEDQRMTRDPLGARIDPVLETIVANADEDLRTLHDQIAVQASTGSEASREAMLATEYTRATGIVPSRIICAGEICEIVGRTGSRRSLEGETLARRIAEANLSPGPAALGAPDATGEQIFVQYVVGEG